MTIQVVRKWFSQTSTCGEMLIDDVFYCYTLEPRQDQSQGKPYCIPVGTYSFILQYSPRFKMATPHILNVPGFTDIEIHPGNWPSDTEGCCLVGTQHQEEYLDPKTSLEGGAVFGSRAAFDGLMKQLLTGGTVTYR
jgi:Family of unknown function (DUF5675)